MKRPTSITVIAWILIVMGAISVVSVLATQGDPKVREMMEMSPIPISLQFAMTYVGLAIMLKYVLFGVYKEVVK